MTLAQLAEHVEMNPRYEAEEATVDDIKGVVVSDTDLDTAVHLSFGRLNDATWEQVQMWAACGKDVKHITRVTGYFSYAGGWNKGKQAELRDRARVKV